MSENNNPFHQKFITKDEQTKAKDKLSEEFLDWFHDRNIEGGFTILHNELLFNNEITPKEKIFYLQLLSKRNKDHGYIFHSNESIAEITGLGIESVKKLLSKLEKKKLIKRLSTSALSKRYICFIPLKRV